MKIKSMQPGDSARIIRLRRGTHARYRQQLLAMGVTPNTEFTFIRRAPFGDPIQIKVRNFNLSLRSHEAELIEIEKI